MDRRSASAGARRPLRRVAARLVERWLAIAFVAVLSLATMSGVSGNGGTVAAQSDEPAPPTTEAPVTTANPFLPEERDLTDCIGLLQRPGCGSEARGGWHQNAVAIAMIGGLVLVFGRVAYGVHKNRQRSATPPDETPAGETPGTAAPAGDTIDSDVADRESPG